FVRNAYHHQWFSAFHHFDPPLRGSGRRPLVELRARNFRVNLLVVRYHLGIAPPPLNRSGARSVMKMRIAVSVSEEEKARRAQSPYVQALLAAGAEGSEIELVSASDAPRVRARDYDGILFTGGEDVDPSFYGEEKRHESVHDHRPLDEFEFALLEGALARRSP